MTSNASSNVVGVHYRVGKKIGEGSFGVLFEGTNMLNNQQIAIKFEPRKSDAPQLRDEYRTYKVLVGCTGIPNVYYFGQEGLHNILVMDLLGPSLEDLFDYCNRQFSVKTTVMIAKQMISRIQHVHEKNFVYRDIKPDNFLIGRPGSKMATVVHVVDFGMAKQYRDPKTKQHIPYRERKALSGTARYMSINTHLGREQSRRDDLEALGHVFLYFLRGGLPWQGMRAANNKVKYEKIGEKKQMISAKELCDGYPDEFRIYLEYCRNLGFEETPDYDYLRELLTKALRNAGQVEDGEYDFMLINDGKGWDAPHKYTSDRPAAAAGNATTRDIHSGRPAPTKAQVSDDRLNAALPKPGATWPRNKPAVGDRRRTDQRFTDPTPGHSGSGQYQDRIAMQRARDGHGTNNLGTNGRQSEPSSALQSREDTPTQPHAQAPITAAQPQPARRQSNVVRTMDADVNAGQRQQEQGVKGFFRKLCCQA